MHIRGVWIVNKVVVVWVGGILQKYKVAPTVND